MTASPRLDQHNCSHCGALIVEEEPTERCQHCQGAMCETCLGQPDCPFAGVEQAIEYEPVGVIAKRRDWEDGGYGE